jgi:hypothetical protein
MVAYTNNPSIQKVDMGDSLGYNSETLSQKTNKQTK